MSDPLGLFEEDKGQQDPLGLFEEIEAPKKKGSDVLGYNKAYKEYVKKFDEDAMRPQIPGAIAPIKKTEAEFTKDMEDTYKDKLLGIPDAALSFLTSIPAMAGGAPAALIQSYRKGTKAEDEFNRIVEQNTWTPRTDSGAKYTESLGALLQPFGLSPYAGMVGPARAARKGKVPAEPIKSIEDIIKPPEEVKPVEAPPVPEVLTAAPTGEIYKATPEVEFARQKAAERQAAMQAEAQRTVPFEKVDPLELLPKEEQPFRYEGAVEAPELLGAENVKKTFDPVGERQVAERQLQDDLANMERENFRDQMPEAFAESLRPNLEASRSAFDALEAQAKRLKDQQMELEWNKRNETLPERAVERLRKEDIVATLEDMQASIAPERVSKGQKRKAMNQMAGALDFQSIVEAFPVFRGSRVQQPLYHGMSNEYDGGPLRKSAWGDLGSGVYLTDNPKMSSNYAQGVRAGNTERKTQGSNHQVYANLQTPFTKDVLLSNEGWRKWIADTYFPEPDSWKLLTGKNKIELEAVQNTRQKLLNNTASMKDLFYFSDNNLFSHGTDLAKQLEKAGFDGIIADTGKGGSEYVIFNPENVKSAISTSTASLNRGMGNSQAGALRVKDIADGLKKFREKWNENVVDSVKTPITEETIKAKQVQAAKAAKMENILKEKLPEFTDVSTFEEAVSLSRTAKDIDSNPYTRGTASGLNFMAAYHKNPLLRYARKLITEARGEATKFSRDYVSGPNGVSVAIQKLSKEDKIAVNQILTQLDKHEVSWTPELADKLNANEAVRAYMDAHTKAFDANWEWHKSITDAQGLETAGKRAGYSPGVFYGAYASLVTAPDSKGNMRVVGMIAADTPGEFQLAMQHYKEAHEGVKFSANTWQEARKSFSGGQQQAFKYKNLNQMMELLGNVDGDLAKVNIKIAQDALRASTELYGMDKHNFAKKGITGNQGNKPWMDAAKNAEERLNSIVKYLEDSAEYNAMQKPSEELRLLMADDSTAHMPKAKAYLDDYFRNVAGSYVNPVGKIMNIAFDVTHNIAEQIGAHIPGFKNHIGPGNTLKLSNQLKNKMAQFYMGWFNWMFTASQLAQPIQTGGPIALLAANKLDIPYHEVSASLVKGGTDYIKATLAQHGLVELDARTQRILEYGNNQGLLDFTELERAYEGNKGKAERAFDKTAEYSMQIGEQVTRPPMFFAFVDMLSRVEPDLERVLPVAEHLTNQAMADYHKWERPLMYNGLGVLAPHAGGLTTFKHNYMGTQALLAQEVRNVGKRPITAIAPLGASVLGMLAFAGITGTPFYDELNTIYEQIRHKLTGEKRSISQDFLNDIDQHWKTGAVSSILDLNMQGKFSSADMLPGGSNDTFLQSLGKGAFPHLSGAADIAGSFAAAAGNPNSTNLANAAVAATPSGWKQAANSMFRRDDENWMLDKKGMRDVQRTPEQWKASAATGLVPLQEAEDKNRRFQNIENEKARKEDLTSLSQDWKAAIIADESPIKQAEILNKYEKLGGNPAALIQQIPKIKMEAEKSAEERLRGVPRSPQGLRRYEAFDN